MRVLIALNGHALLRRGIAIEPGARQRDIDATAQALARIAVEHEVVIAHGGGVEVGSILELGLRNAVPDREIVTVLSQVVVGGDDVARGARSEPPLARPRAIVGLRSLRTLIDAGALVICATGEIPVAIDGDGTMCGVDAEVDKDLIAGLLARRLDADLLLMLTDVDAAGHEVEAACSFVEATGRRAAIGATADAVEMVCGAAGTQIAPVTAQA
ncbi:MAG TPA: hypothetical protein VFT10_00010 [Solirubrobacterales bacterium]|nr:hypothetical protein [Solirubrobacterales bacterium]